jgi:hypothetical protein
MKHRNGRLIGIGIALAVIIAGLFLAGPALTRYARSAVKDELQKSGKVDVGEVHVTLFPSIHVVLDNIAFRAKGRTDVPPLFTIDQAIAQTNWFSVFAKHVSEVRLKGLRIQVPPRRGGDGLSKPEQAKQSGVVIDRIVADGAVLRIMPKDPRRDPLEFVMNQLTLHHAGPNQAMRFETVLENAKPPGEIHSTGDFGPWQFDDPAETPVSGKYTFRDANLSVFKGISGTLSSDGQYSGVLDNINVSGATDTPDFTVRVSGLPVHLKTQFKAVVDGSNGNTYLQPVDAQFGRSSVTARGAVEGQPGVHGKTVSLDVVVNDGRLEDMLRLAVKSEKPSLTGGVSFHTKLVIPPGDVDVAQKLQLDGAFQVKETHFTQMNVQEKVDELSHRASGDPEASPDDQVASNFHGQFKMKDGVIRFANLTFTVPSAAIALNGSYGMIDQHLDFHGTARMAAKVSQMTTGIKSFFLKAIDPFFEKKNAGAVIPIKIEGTRESPKFGLDLGGKH